MSFEKTKWVWQDGKFLRWDEAKIHSSAFGFITARAFLKGFAVMKTAEGPAIFPAERAHGPALRVGAGLFNSTFRTRRRN